MRAVYVLILIDVKMMLLLDLLVQSLMPLMCCHHVHGHGHVHGRHGFVHSKISSCILLLDLLVQPLAALSRLGCHGRRFGHSKISSCILYMLFPKYIFTTYGRAIVGPTGTTPGRFIVRPTGTTPAALSRLGLGHLGHSKVYITYIVYILDLAICAAKISIISPGNYYYYYYLK